MQIRSIRHLVEMDVGDPRNLGHRPAKFLSDRQVAFTIDADYLNVDWSGQTEIENLAGDVRGLEVKGAAREPLRQLRTKAVYIIGGGPVLRLQGHQDFAIT